MFEAHVSAVSGPVSTSTIESTEASSALAAAATGVRILPRVVAIAAKASRAPKMTASTTITTRKNPQPHVIADTRSAEDLLLADAPPLFEPDFSLLAAGADFGADLLAAGLRAAAAEGDEAEFFLLAGESLRCMLSGRSRSLPLPFLGGDCCCGETAAAPPLCTGVGAGAFFLNIARGRLLLQGCRDWLWVETQADALAQRRRAACPQISLATDGM